MLRLVLTTLISALAVSGGVSAQVRIGQTVSTKGEFPLACTSMQSLERAAAAARSNNMDRFSALVIAGACEIIREGSRGEILRLDNINGVRIAQVKFQSQDGYTADGWIVVSDLQIIN